MYHLDARRFGAAALLLTPAAAARLLPLQREPAATALLPAAFASLTIDAVLVSSDCSALFSLGLSAAGVATPPSPASSRHAPVTSPAAAAAISQGASASVGHRCSELLLPRVFKS